MNIFKNIQKYFTDRSVEIDGEISAVEIVPFILKYHIFNYHKKVTEKEINLLLFLFWVDYYWMNPDKFLFDNNIKIKGNVCLPHIVKCQKLVYHYNDFTKEMKEKLYTQIKEISEKYPKLIQYVVVLLDIHKNLTEQQLEQLATKIISRCKLNNHGILLYSTLIKFFKNNEWVNPLTFNQNTTKI